MLLEGLGTSRQGRVNRNGTSQLQLSIRNDSLQIHLATEPPRRIGHVTYGPLFTETGKSTVASETYS